MKSKVNLLESNRFAIQGVKFSFLERSTRIHYLAVICTTTTGLILKVSIVEWCAIFIMFALVISLEMVNTAVEVIIDMVSPEFNKDAGKAKDLTAGASFVSIVVAVIVGIIIFAPKIMALYT